MAHHSAGLGVVLPYVGHRARPVQVGVHRQRHNFITHIGHIAVRPLAGHHRLQVIPQFRQITKCRLAELNLVYCRNTHRPSCAKYQSIPPPSSARFRGGVDTLRCADRLSASCRMRGAHSFWPFYGCYRFHIRLYCIVLTCKNTKNYRIDKYIFSAQKSRPAYRGAGRCGWKQSWAYSTPRGGLVTVCAAPAMCPYIRGPRKGTSAARRKSTRRLVVIPPGQDAPLHCLACLSSAHSRR